MRSLEPKPLLSYLPLRRFDETELEVRLVSRRRWQLISELRYLPPLSIAQECPNLIDRKPSPRDEVAAVVVPVGFFTDLASIPRWARWLTVRDAETAAAAVVHDRLYRVGDVPRCIADRIMLDAMQVTGVHAARRAAIYAALRLGGWVPWRRLRRRN